jgi:hypothetical protein
MGPGLPIRPRKRTPVTPLTTFQDRFGAIPPRLARRNGQVGAAASS